MEPAKEIQDLVDGAFSSNLANMSAHFMVGIQRQPIIAWN